MPQDQQPDFVFNPSAIQTVLINGLMVLSIVISFFVTLAGAVISAWNNRDLASIIVFVRSNDFIVGVGALGTISSTAIFVWRVIRKYREKIAVAEAAPNSVAVVATPAEAKELGLK